MPGPNGSVPPLAAASWVRYSIVLGESRRSGGRIPLGCCCWPAGWSTLPGEGDDRAG